MIAILPVVGGSILLAELYGYWLHVLLHSYKIPALSRAHMAHHILSYGPGERQRSVAYIQEVEEGTTLIAGLGLEWLIPALFLLGFTVGLEWLLGLPWAYIAVSITTILAYTAFLFWWLHDRMHVKGTWLTKNRLVRRSFMRARKLHDIHHHHVTDDGLMNVNYGIATPLFDHVFGSYLGKLKGLNRAGIYAALVRYRKKT